MAGRWSSSIEHIWSRPEEARLQCSGVAYVHALNGA